MPQLFSLVARPSLSNTIDSLSYRKSLLHASSWEVGSRYLSDVAKKIRVVHGEWYMDVLNKKKTGSDSV